MDYSSLPKKKATGPEQLQAPDDNADEELAPNWDDLSDEAKAYHKSPMDYARKMLNAKIQKANDEPDL